MFDQCGYYMSLLQDLVEEACLISVVTVWYDMSLLQDLVEEACLISVVTICRCCKTWWRGMFDQCGTICRCCKTWWRRHV